MGFLRRGEPGPTPEHQQIMKDRLQQAKDQITKAPRSRESLDRTLQDLKDRKAKAAQGQAKAPNSDAPRVKDTPPYHGPPDIVAEKNRLLHIPPEERLKIVKERTLSTLRQEWTTALQAGDNQRAAQLLRLISNLDNPVSEE